MRLFAGSPGLLCNPLDREVQPGHFGDACGPGCPPIFLFAFLSGFCRYPMPGGNGTEAVCRLSWVALQPVGPGGTAGGTLGRLAARCIPPSVQSCAPLCGRRARTRHSARPRPRKDIRTYLYLPSASAQSRVALRPAHRLGCLVAGRSATRSPPRQEHKLRLR